MKNRLVFVLIALLTMGSICPTRPEPKEAQYILKPASGSPPMAVAVACADNLDCDTVAGKSACTVSQGCSKGECKFAVAPGPTCPCYEGDIRWCGSGTNDVQFCAEITSGQTGWQAECGPSNVSCPTAYPANPACSQGTVSTIFDITKAQWIPTPGGTCAPSTSCPTDGALQRCTPSGQSTACGLQTHSRASGWSGCDASNCPAACVPSTEVCDGRDNDCNGTPDDSIAATPCVAAAAGVCSAGRNVCVNGRLECEASPPQSEVCDGADNNCDGLADPMGTCGEVVVRQQSDSDNGKEMTMSPSLPTDLIDVYRTHGGPCGEDDHGRPYYRTRAEVSAWSGHGALCELAGPYGGYVSQDKTDCKIRVHYKTTRMGSNVWCSGTWWATPVGAYRR